MLNMCLFQAMGRREGPQIEHIGTKGHDKDNYEVSQPLEGGQGQVSGSKVPLLGHGEEIETQNLAYGDY